MAKDNVDNFFGSGQSTAPGEAGPAGREEQGGFEDVNSGKPNKTRSVRDGSADKDKAAAGDSAADRDKTAAGDGATVGDKTEAGDGATAGNTAAAADDKAAEEAKPAADASETGGEAEAGKAETQAADTGEEAVAADGDSAAEAEATPVQESTEAASTPDRVPSSNNGFVWVAVGAVAVIAVILLLKRFVFDRKAGNGGKGARASQPRGGAEDVKKGRHIARTVGQVAATMVADDLQAQSPYSIGCAQWIGRREDQEDALMVSEWRNANAVANQGILAAVADGIGGLDDGQVASQTLMRSFQDGFERLDPELSPQGKLLELTARGQREVVDINRRGRRCGTTLVAVLIQGGYLSTISVGDSRIALYRSGVLLQLNREHVNARISDEETAFDGAAPVEGRRRAALTSFIGKEDFRELDRTLNPIRLISGDRVLLMSDGVFGTLNDDQLIALLEQDAQQAADSIIDQVQRQKNQYQDNTTVVVIEVK